MLCDRSHLKAVEMVKRVRARDRAAIRTERTEEELAACAEEARARAAPSGKRAKRVLKSNDFAKSK